VTEVERISIRVPGVDEQLGRRLGELVAAGLAPSLRTAPGVASLDLLRVELAAQPGESAEALAGRIATAISLRLAGAGVLEAGR
jgi:hypothetical protein